jgi:hypothetical protein
MSSPREMCRNGYRSKGFEDIGAGWKMVIMDALDETVAFRSIEPLVPAEFRPLRPALPKNLGSGISGNFRLSVGLADLQI